MECRGTKIRVMSLSSYKDLRFWQTSKNVSLLVVKLVKKLPNERTSWVITDQLLRSSFSVGANITEGFGKYKGKEYARFIQVALGSARETEYWLELLKEIYPQLSNDMDKILLFNEETIKMLVATLKTLRK